MKAFIFVLIVILFSSIVYGQDLTEDWTGVCDSISSMAGVIMEHRQAGTPIQAVIATAKENRKAEDDTELGTVLYYFSILFIEKAYAEPKWVALELKKEAIEEFENEAYLGCIRNFREIDKEWN